MGMGGGVDKLSHYKILMNESNILLRDCVIERGHNILWDITVTSLLI